MLTGEMPSRTASPFVQIKARAPALALRSSLVERARGLVLVVLIILDILVILLLIHKIGWPRGAAMLRR